MCVSVNWLALNSKCKGTFITVTGGDRRFVMRDSHNPIPLAILNFDIE